MNDMQNPIISTKLPPIRRPLPSRQPPTVNMIKLERGLVQRSLLYCLDKGYFTLVRYILQSGTGDARERDTEGRTGLMYCCFIDNDGWAQNISMMLLEYGAKIEDQDQRGLNALHYAIITQRLILIQRYLCSHECDLNRTTDIHGNTFLHYACSTGNSDVVRLILNAINRYSFDLNIKNNSGLTAYDIACQLKHEQCQDLLRNALLFRRNQHLPPIKSNGLRVSFESFNDRRSSTLQLKSFVSLPVCASKSNKTRQRFGNVVTSSKENFLQSSSIFIDPIESRHMTLKHNENLDLSLVNQAKTRADFAPATPLISQSSVYTNSSSTWRDDVSKVFNQLQTYKTPTYRKTVHPPLNKELSCEVFERLYGLPGSDGHDCSNHQPLSSLPMLSSQKIIHRRRSSSSSTKSLFRAKK